MVHDDDPETPGTERTDGCGEADGVIRAHGGVGIRIVMNQSFTILYYRFLKCFGRFRWNVWNGGAC